MEKLYEHTTIGSDKVEDIVVSMQISVFSLVSTGIHTEYSTLDTNRSAQYAIRVYVRRRNFYIQQTCTDILRGASTCF